MPKKQPQKVQRKRQFSWLLIGMVFLTFILLADRYQNRNKITNDEFERYLSEKKIASLTIKGSEIIGTFNKAGISSRPPSASKTFSVNYQPEIISDIIKKIEISGTQWTVAPPQIWVSVFSMLFPIILIIAFFYFMFARNMKSGPGGMLMGFGKSKHKMQGQGQSKVTFDNVAGIDEAKEEVAEIIEFLKYPKKFRKIGGRIPRGILLIGPPGCGKTLLAKAIAGQANVPFFSISGSDFVEMFVGVGASRVRDLFTQAKANSPCIIFLDEIDAIGRKRGPGFVSGGHDEREQTLNAILVEMDGFGTNDQVIVMAATNRGDILDNALTRPGRFDRQVFVSLPDIKGRAAILKIHSKGIRMGPDVDLEMMARGTPMFSGADLEAIINEAAIAATLNNKDFVEMADLEEARDKVRWGRSKRSKTIDQADKKLTAYHEGGHTLVQSLLEDADPLHKVSIIPRGPMGGATFSLPKKDRDYLTRKYCMAQMQVAFGGRVAEELFCEDISSGASSDIKTATALARKMVKTWGMSDAIGPIDYDSQTQDMMFGIQANEYSEKTSEAIDKEIKNLLDTAYKNSRHLIENNRQKLVAIAQALLKYETLDAAEVKILLEGGILTKPTVNDLLKTEQEKIPVESEIKPDQSKPQNEEIKPESE